MLPPKGPAKIHPKALVPVRGGRRRERRKDADGLHVGVARVLGRPFRPRNNNPLRGIGGEQLEQSDLPARVQGEEPPRPPHLQDNVRAQVGPEMERKRMRKLGGVVPHPGLVDRLHGQQEAGHG